MRVNVNSFNLLVKTNYEPNLAITSGGA